MTGEEAALEARARKVRNPKGAVQRYRKKLAFAEAARWQPGDPLRAGEVVGWLLAHFVDFDHQSGLGETTTLAIRTPEGEITARPGDWIICGTEGEFCLCLDSVFKQTYELAGGTA